MSWRHSTIHTLAILCFCLPISAMPLPVASGVALPSATPVYLTLALCTPFVLLAALKFSYLKYRRAQSIHCYGTLSHLDCTKASRLLGLGYKEDLQDRTRKSRLRMKVSKKLGMYWNSHQLSGYVVGFLGSPHWETRMKVKVDTATRKSRPSSSFIQSRTGSPSVAISTYDGSRRSRKTTTSGHRTSSYGAASRYSSRYSSSRSRSMSASFLEMLTPDGNITNCSTVHPSSPACAEDHTLPAIPPEVLRLNSGSTRSRRHVSTPSLSPTLMQVMEPVIASWRTNSTKDKSVSPDSSHNRGQSRSVS